MGPYRNHPVLLLKYVLICAFMSVIIAISAQMPILLLVGLIPLFFFVRIWFKTRYTFDDYDVKVEKIWTRIQKDGKHAIIKLADGYSAEDVGMRIGIY